MKGAWLTISCVLGLAACQPPTPPAETSAKPLTPGGHESARVKGEYLLATRPGTDAAMLRQAFDEFRIRRIESLGANRWRIVFEDDPDPQAVARVVEKHAAILFSQPNYRYRQQSPAPLR